MSRIVTSPIDHTGNGALIQDGHNRHANGSIEIARALDNFRYTLIVICGLSVLILLLYSRTLGSMIDVWLGSSTFAHGFLIIPISAFIVWQKRLQVGECELKPSISGFTCLVLSVLLWWLSNIANVQLGAQFGLIAIICSGIWSVCGWDIVKILRFPLAFAFFAVPFGDFLEVPLMGWTADFTVRALTLTGIPVYLEGYRFSLPTGSFEVVEACSGVRFLITAIVLATFFSYQRMRLWRERLLFVLGASLAMILANGVRAYLVVLIAHLSATRHGAGFDHVYIGWIVFASVFMTICWFGAKATVSAEPETSQNRVHSGSLVTSTSCGRPKISATWTAATVFVIALGPLLLRLDQTPLTEHSAQTFAPVAKPKWTGPGPVRLSYRPLMAGARSRIAASYAQPGGSVDLHAEVFVEQTQGNELIGHNNQFYDPMRWRIASRSENVSTRIDDDRTISAKSILLTDGSEKILVWYWYDIGGWLTAGEYQAKAFHAIQAALGNARSEALIALATGVSGDDETQASLLLASFARDYLVPLQTCLRVSTVRPHSCSTWQIE